MKEEAGHKTWKDRLILVLYDNVSEHVRKISCVQYGKKCEFQTCTQIFIAARSGNNPYDLGCEGLVWWFEQE